jgi:tripartite-type tricarboxylate transporter receptor subunit TctC
LPAQDALPDVPALTTFYPDAEYIPWQAAFAPKGTPKHVVGKLNAEIGRALNSPEIAARLRKLHLAPTPSAPEDLDRTLRADLTLNRELVTGIGLKLD